jgi:hypothetical protein
MTEVVFATYYMVWITLFLVAKKNGKGRLIGDARVINDVQPGSMGQTRSVGPQCSVGGSLP